MKEALGATAAPAHPRSIEAYADEVAHGALCGACADVEILPAQVPIAQAALVLDQVLEDFVEAIALALVVWTGLWDRGVGVAQRFDDGKDSPLAQPSSLLADPSTQLFGALGVDALARGPELLDDVVPVQTHLRVGEVDLLKTPDMLRAISKEHCLLLAVATLERLAVQPYEERFVALEGRDEPLVDGSLDALGSAAQGVDDADDRQFGVLALVAFCAPLARMLTSAKAASVAPCTVKSLVWASSSLVLGLGDHRRAAPVDLHHEDLTVVVGRGKLFEERARMIANRVDHTQSGARARSPLVRLAKRVARRGERHLSAQPCHGEHHAKAETGAQAELAVDRQVTRAPADATANRSRERDLPEARAQLAGALAAPNVASTVMLVVDGSKLRCLLRQELPNQRSPECEEQRPQPPLERVERPRFLRFGPTDRIGERLLDVTTHMINTAFHRGSSFKYLNSQLDICRERAPKFNLHLASDRFCFVLCRQIGNCTHQIRYSWNYALLLSEGPTLRALVPSPLFVAMRDGILARFEEITRCPPEVQDTMVSILSEKLMTVPELEGDHRLLFARPGFNVIATANIRDRGVHEMSSALKRRFNFETVHPIADLDAEVELVHAEATKLLGEAGVSIKMDRDVV